MHKRSWVNLAGVHPRLYAVMCAAYARGPIDFIVTEGLRSDDRQRELFRAGKTWTLNSKHLDGRAVDIACLDPLGQVTWDLHLYREVWLHQVKPSAQALGVSIAWGGDWKKVDGPHFELA